MARSQDDAALADTHARLLALEIVTTAVLNQLAAKDPRVQAVLEELVAPPSLPDPEAVGSPDDLAHLRANVSRLAGAIATRL